MGGSGILGGMLFINNDDVAKVLTMDMTIAALEDSYRGLATEDTVCRPRIDIRIPTTQPGKTYQWGTMEGGSTSGYFAIRMKSDVVEDRARPDGGITQEKYCTRPGLYCGLVFLTAVEDGEPLALINDGLLQHMRVGADGAIGAKYLANEDAEVVGMLGSGGMARSHVESLRCVRPIRKVQVFSPTRANREAFEAVYRGAHIVAALTDSTIPVLDGSRLEPGTHLVNIGGGGLPDAASLARVDVYLRFGSTPPPRGREDTIDDEYLVWAAKPGREKRSKKSHGVALPDKVIYLKDILSGRHPGRTSRDQVTWSERGNLQGAQFYAVAAKVYEAAKARGLGREIPTEWFLQDIRD